MSSPKKVRGKSGKDDKRDDSDSEDLNFLKTLPSSSKKKTSIKQVFEKKVKSEKVKPSLPNFSRNDYGYLFEEPSESESDETVWDDNIFFKRDGWNSEDTEAAGPSSTVSSVLPVQHHEYSDPNEKTTLWHDSNKGTVSLLL